ncbi:MAG TPA: hypothetical protein VK735_08910 [Pseudonocardia sp.]|uniref:hypothetical protein n=1 Tax=Pseudonocardia sp. TaxID=60912 RepID=UPI002CAC9258|nr:hypothetical protein [Pseudonocardia sp.]HTF47552.1 hypothetical protein [Pseudonocardia sp.]
MDSEIHALFDARAAAVYANDRPSFLSTQVSEIDLGSSDGYLSLRDLTIELLHTHDESDIEKVVLVKETYTRDELPPRSSFLLYYLIRTVVGWRIYRIR